MGRFPVTLYKEQWLKLLDMSDDIRAFIAANEAHLKIKDWWRATSSMIALSFASYPKKRLNAKPSY